LDPALQSRCRYKEDHPEWGVKKGDRELSWGLVQIHLPTNPNVKKEQATDPEFSIKYLASHAPRKSETPRGGRF
jgi:hypothetical protein